jgi:hypothetical protein
MKELTKLRMSFSVYPEEEVEADFFRLMVAASFAGFFFFLGFPSSSVAGSYPKLVCFRCRGGR